MPATAYSSSCYFNFLCPIWGQKYVDDYFDIVVPSLLAPGNLPALADEEKPTFTFLTRRADRRQIKRHAGYKRLSRYANLKLILIDDIIGYARTHYGGHAVHVINLAYIRGFQSELRDHNTVFFVILNADKLFSRNSFASVIGVCKQGYRVIYHANFRACAEEVNDILASSVDGGILDVSSRELLDLGLKYLHPVSRAYFWENGEVSSPIANQFYWRVDDEGVLARFYLTHPLVVRPQKTIREWNGFIDYALVPHACSNDEDIYYIQNSDELFSLEFAPSNHEANFLVSGRYSVETCAGELAKWTNLYHRKNSKQILRFFLKDPTPEKWRRAEQHSNEVMNAIDHFLTQVPPLPVDGHPYWGNNLVRFKRYISEKKKSGSIGTIWSALFYKLGLNQRAEYLNELDGKRHELRQINRELAWHGKSRPQWHIVFVSHRLATIKLELETLLQVNAERRYATNLKLLFLTSLMAAVIGIALLIIFLIVK